jgi:hypothetical protein
VKWVIVVAVAVAIVAVAFLVFRKLRRAGGIVAIPSQSRSTSSAAEPMRTKSPIPNLAADTERRQD